ncbi:unnamed protein product, partial [Mycena citricolor]
KFEVQPHQHSLPHHCSREDWPIFLLWPSSYPIVPGKHTIACTPRPGAGLANCGGAVAQHLQATALSDSDAYKTGRSSRSHSQPLQNHTRATQPQPLHLPPTVPLPLTMSSTVNSTTSSSSSTSPKNYEAAFVALQSSFGVVGQSVPRVDPKPIKGAKKTKTGKTATPSTPMTRFELAHADLMAKYGCGGGASVRTPHAA